MKKTHAWATPANRKPTDPLACTDSRLVACSCARPQLTIATWAATPPALLRPHSFVLHAAAPALLGSGVPVPLAKSFGICQIRFAAGEPRVAWQAKLESRFALAAGAPFVAGNSTTSNVQNRYLQQFYGSQMSSPGSCRLRQSISPALNFAAANFHADLRCHRYTGPGALAHTRPADSMGNTDNRGNNSRDSYTHTGNPSPNQG
jgi:hypothetical protein